MNAKTDAISFFTMAESYQESAKLLAKANNGNSLSLRHDAPIYMLYAHTVELALKGLLVLNGHPKEKLAVEFGHNLHRAFEALSPYQQQELDSYNTGQWNKFLRSARDDYQSSFNSLGLEDTQTLEEFGVFDDKTIAASIPKLNEQLAWLSDRHKHRGSVFRYFEERKDTVNYIKAFGLSENTVFKTMEHLAEGAKQIFRISP